MKKARHALFSTMTLLVLLLAHFQGVGQACTFVKTYNSGNTGYVVRESNGINYVLAGCTDYYYNFNWFIMSPIPTTNIQLVKTTTDGTLVWEKIFNYPGSRMLATWMEHTNDDGYIITGSTNQEQTWPPDSNDVVLIKTDLNGVLQWSKKFDTGKDELAFCVRQTNDGGFIISAFHDALPLSLVGNTYAMLIKTDASGNLIWNKKYSLAVRDLDTAEPMVWTVKQTSDHGYILIGTTAASHAADILVIRTDSTGNVIWSKSYEHDNSAMRFAVGLDIIENFNGEFVIAAALDKDQTLNQYNYPFIMKVNSNGDIIDQRFYDSNPFQMFQSGFSSVTQEADSGYFFTGGGGYGGFGMQAQLLKTDKDFNMVWSRTYTNDGLVTTSSRSGTITSDGCYIFTGKKMIGGTVLMKTDHIGMIDCKTPGNLIEMAPSMIANDRFPTVLSGINESNLLLNTLPGMADTSTLCPVTSTLLPIELLSFEGKKISDHEVELKWVTAAEKNNDHFIIEKSYDGINFNEIDKVKGAGNSNRINNYEFIDWNNDFHERIYYRLKQVDYDGQQSTSSIVAVKFKNESLNILSIEELYEGQEIKLNVSSKEKQNFSVQLCNTFGQVIMKEFFKTSGGLESFHLGMNRTPHGIYIISILLEDKIVSKKLVY
jgi:hypothetical protein